MGANTEKFIFGSAVFEVGEEIGSLQEIGAARNVVFAETFDEIEVEDDIYGKLLKRIANHECVVSSDALEFDLEKMALIRGGLDSFSTVAGTLEEGAEQVIESGDWGFKKTIVIENQNHDLGAVTVNSVTGSVDTLLTVDDDYFVTTNEKGETCITFNDASGTNLSTETQQITIDYDYTPAASQELATGGKFTIAPRVVRLTNTNESGEKFEITVFSGTAGNGITINFPSIESGEVAVTPIEIKGRRDRTKTAGEQLFKIVNEQGL